MQIIRSLLDKVHPNFEEGGRLHKFFPLYEAIDTFLYSPGDVTKGPTHVRDAIDLKRMMIIVVVALFPCMIMAMYNTGYQVNSALERIGLLAPYDWRGQLLSSLGVSFQSTSWFSCMAYGATFFLPVLLVTNLVGAFWEILFAAIRKHQVNEGFLVTGVLFPLTLPPTIPLWQVAIGISFGVVFGKEIFGGTGKNFLNPALTARAFLFFAYPAQISGDAVWIGLDPQSWQLAGHVDGFSGATALSIAAAHGVEGLQQAGFTLWNSFLGFIPGSMGETSKLACLFGAAVLMATGIGSWQIMLSMLAGTLTFSSLLFSIGSTSNPMFSLSPLWHLVIGSFAFGTVFMATDPVSAAMTRTGKYLYGFLVGSMVVLVRSLNPAFPEGVMLAILFGNVCAPLIDYLVVKQNIKRRLLRTQGVGS